MDDFLSQQASLNPAGLYRSPDGGLSLIPAGPYGPGELEGNDELGLLSSSNPTPPLHHPGIREPQASEVRCRTRHIGAWVSVTEGVSPRSPSSEPSGHLGGNTPSGKLAYPAQVAGSYFDPGHGPTTPLGQQICSLGSANSKVISIDITTEFLPPDNALWNLE
ncbi:hypothetical protein BGW80DRAFT_1249932 [Lactifluus volemus]|nr:hypothetical protein BGW80DRAFT_1249932 [Lactifluus volemus]